MPTGAPIDQVGTIKVGEQFKLAGYEVAQGDSHGRVLEIRPYDGKWIDYFTHMVTYDNNGTTPSGQTTVCIKESEYQ